MGGGPYLKLGTCDIYISKNDNIILERIDYKKYNGRIIE